MEKKQKRILVACSVVFASIFILLGIIYSEIINTNKATNIEVTRYEWIKMLCEKNGITEHDNHIAYFQDVKEDNPYFPYVQSAVEWGILEKGIKFEGESVVNGKYVALTAMKTIGQAKIQIYLGNNKKVTDNTYIKLAIKSGLIEKNQLNERFSEEACKKILDDFEVLYFSTFWKDDYSHIEYKDDVIQLAASNVLEHNEDCSRLMLNENTEGEIEEGAIVIFEQKSTKLKIAREIKSIETDGTMLLMPVELADVAETLIVSDINELTLGNIVNYYELEKTHSTVSNLDYHLLDNITADKAGFSFGKKNKGFRISLSTTGEGEEKHLIIQVADKNTGITYELPISVAIEADSEYEAAIDVDKMYIGGQVLYSALNNGIEYADVAVDAHATLSGTIKAKEEKRILLCETPVPLGNGIIGVDIQIYLVLSVEGGISFEAQMPIQASLCYEANRGIRSFEPDIMIEDPVIEANCSGELMLRVEPILVILGCVKVVDAELDVGIVANADSTVHPNSQICTDVFIAFPVITFGICKDEDAKSIMGSMGISAEWEIISAEKAPYQMGVHYERLPNRVTQFVDKCTYGENEIKENERVIESFNNTYRTRYGEVNQVESGVFCFDYPDNWSVEWEEVQDINEEVMYLSSQGECATVPTDDIYMNYYGERVELTNDRGVLIEYIKYTMSPGAVGNGSAYRYEMEYDIVKVADSKLKSLEISEVENDNIFMVAKIRTDKDSHIYAVLPQTKEGLGKTDIVSFQGVCSFDYPTPYSFIAEAPEGQFTEEEEREVIAILSSLRVADDVTPLKMF